MLTCWTVIPVAGRCALSDHTHLHHCLPANASAWASNRTVPLWIVQTETNMSALRINRVGLMSIVTA